MVERARVSSTSSRFFLGQYTGATWKAGAALPNRTGKLAPPVMRGGVGKESQEKEDEAASFYSGVDVMAVSPGSLNARIAIGTTRVWVSEDWTPSGTVANTWKTLPSGIDPRGRNPRDNGTDVFDEELEKIIALRWHPDGRLFVLYQRGIIVFTPPKSGAGVRWSKQGLTKPRASAAISTTAISICLHPTICRRLVSGATSSSTTPRPVRRVAMSPVPDTPNSTTTT